jgi:nitroreductase
MLAPNPEPTVASLFAPRARIEPDGTVIGYASLITELARRRSRLDEMPRFEAAEYNIYPPDLKEPYEARRRRSGVMLYESIDVAREDRPGRYRQYARNFLFYDAPAGLFFSIDRSMGPPQWSDLGGFLQNVMLIARGHGLHTCAQEAWTHLHKTLASFLPLPPELMLFCGMALGHADESAPINAWRSPREPVDGFATFSGFAT